MSWENRVETDFRGCRFRRSAPLQRGQQQRLRTEPDPGSSSSGSCGTSPDATTQFCQRLLANDGIRGGRSYDPFRASAVLTRSNARTVPSRLALRSACPEGNHSTPTIGAVCSLKVTKQKPLCMFQTLTYAYRAQCILVRSEKNHRNRLHPLPWWTSSSPLHCGQQHHLGVVCARGNVGAVRREGGRSDVEVVPLLLEDVAL